MADIKREHLHSDRSGRSRKRHANHGFTDHAGGHARCRRISGILREDHRDASQPAGTAWGAANSSQLIDCNQATAKVTLTSEKLSLSTSGLIFPQITFDFTSNQSGTAFAVQQDGPVGWTTVATVSNSTRASFSRDLIASGATSTFRVVFLDVAGNVRDVLYEGIQVRRPTNNTVTGVAGFE